MGFGLIMTMVSVLISVVVFGVVGFVIYRVVLKPMQTNKRLLQTGQRAKARILSIAETGVRVNNSPQVKLGLEIAPESGYPPPYQTEARMLISIVQIPQFQPGAKLIVRFNPQNPAEVAIEGTDLS